ncbi:hypothetical protein M758_UG073500 [Ceratodon purpureus]|nr:hypothetical protein M758_UG073500 [Ceratodon purpureus]
MRSVLLQRLRCRQRHRSWQAAAPVSILCVSWAYLQQGDCLSPSAPARSKQVSQEVANADKLRH